MSKNTQEGQSEDRHLRLVVADDEQDMRDYFADTLPDLGHEVVAVAKTGHELLELSRQYQPDLIITDIRMPDGDGLSAAKQYAQERFTPVILFTAFHDSKVLEEANDSHVFAYLVKPIDRAQLESTIAIAWQRYEQFSRLRQETNDLRQALDDRKVIERAKGILMKERQLDEQDAFRRLQKLARDENKKLAEVARMIIIAFKA
ncbi:MAG: response regulator [Planctomycetales bacterium]|nr:response regulator [Planctomycetales bacterium]MCA9166920.1 response regulator [Planctomycetales bacterium]